MTDTIGLFALRAPEGCVAYLVWDLATRQALVIDPRLDQVEQLLEAAHERKLRVKAVMDTHTHADHLSGARRLAERAQAELLAPAGSRLRAPARRIVPGQCLELGRLSIELLAAPGHTPDAAAILVEGHLFSGDALFVEGIGRTDFPGGSPEDALRTLETFAALPPETVLHPGHDYQGRVEATLGTLLREHPVLSEPDPARRLELVSARGAVIPDIRELLEWNLLEREGEDLPPRAVQALLRGGSAVLVDVRSPAELAQSRIPGALNIPLPELESRLFELPVGREVVLTCRTGLRARAALETLQRHGREARLLEGSLEGWRRAGLPLIEAASGALSIDRQVQLVVGSGVLVGTLLGAFVSSWFLILPGFFGAGLAFAGASGTCGMAHLLARLPWNRPAAAAPAAAPAPLCTAGGAAPSCSAGAA